MAAGQTPAVVGETGEQVAQRLGIALDPLVAQTLVELAQGERMPGAVVGVRRLLAQRGQHGALDRADPFQGGHGRLGDLVAQEGAELRTLVQQPGAGHVVQCAHDALAGGLAPVPGRRIARRRAEDGEQGQLVGGQTLVGVAVHQRLEHREPAPLLVGRESERCPARPRHFQVPDRRPALEDTGTVLVALDEAGALEPGDRDPDAGVGIGVIGPEPEP